MKRLFPGYIILSIIIVFTALFLGDCKKPERIIKVKTLDVLEQDISYDGVLIKGEIYDIGEGTIKDHGIAFRNTEQSGSSFTNISLGSAFAESVFEATLDNPPSHTQYEYKAYASDGSETVYGRTKTFISLAFTVPVLTTIEVTEIGTNEAKSGGYITDDSGSEITARGICWSTSGNPTTSDQKTIDPNPGLGSFVNNLTGMDPATTYFVRAYATNNVGTAYGNQVSFNTNASIAVLTTQEASNILSFHAFVGGEISFDGGADITERGVCYNVIQNPDTSDFKVTDTVTGTGVFTVRITGLEAATDYYVKSYAINEAGIAYGQEESFTTLTEQATGTFTDNRDGREYQWIQLGNQKWMAENLAYLPEVMPPDDIGAWWTRYFVYGYQSNIVSEAIATDNFTEYAVLYNWQAAMAESISNDDNPGALQGVCPDGWHMPSDSEWKELELYLGLSDTEIDNNGARGDVGGDLKEEGTSHWQNPNSGATNFSGFNALPGGMCTEETGYFIDLGEAGYWWSSTKVTDSEPESDAWTRSLQYNNTAIGRNYKFIAFGLSVRCVEGQGYYRPEVSTYDALGISYNSAFVGGTVLDSGNENNPEGGIYWGTDPDPLNNGTMLVILTSGTGDFSVNLTGLSAGQVYYYIAYATNIAGTSYGDTKSFTTAAQTIPTVSTVSVTDISDVSALSTGNVEEEGGSVVYDRGFCYTTTENPTTSDDIVQNADNGTGEFSETLENLIPGTTYYVRAYGTNSTGTGYGDEIEFTTLALPTVETKAVVNISYTSAESGGIINNNGGAAIISRGICWNTAQNPILTDNITTNGTGTGSYTSYIDGLSPGDTYYVRAYATNSVGTAYGQEEAFSTLSLTTPTVTTGSISNITDISADADGEVTDDGGTSITERGICWSTSNNPTISDFRVTYAGETGSFTVTLTSLNSGTTYYFRAYATNSQGTNYGQEDSFTTQSLPTVTTAAVTNITHNSAESGGDVTDAGSGSLPDIGVCWNTSGSPTLSDSYTTDGTGSGGFSSVLTGLELNTTYHVRAYATNEWGTAYGDEVFFTTDATASPIAYYPFHTTTDDESAHGRDAINYGAIYAYDRFGNAVNALYFDNSYLDCQDVILPETGDFTINMWIYPDSLACHLWGQYESSSDGRIYGGIDYSTGKAIFSYAGTGTVDIFSTNTLQLKKWQMLTFIRDGNILRLYLDGILQDFGSTDPMNILQRKFLIGIKNETDEPEEAFNGLMDEVKIFDIAIPQSQITDLYQENGWTGELTVSDYDGNSYTVVHIGTQLWMTENLKTTSYNNGGSIPLVEADFDWTNLNGEGYCWYSNNSGYKDTYGALYSWYTANNANLCPGEWHVPTNSEWTALTDFLGGTGVAGGKLKETGTTYWTSPNTSATNKSGFTARPGGRRNESGGDFSNLNDYGFWWCSDEIDASNAYDRWLEYDSGSVLYNSRPKGMGHSVRCIKNED